MDVRTTLLFGLHALQVAFSVLGCQRAYLFLSMLRVVDVPVVSPTSPRGARSKKDEGDDDDGDDSKKLAPRSSAASTQVKTLQKTRSVALRGGAAAILSLLASAYKLQHFAPAWSHLALTLLVIGVLMAARTHILSYFQTYRPGGGGPGGAPAVAAAYPSATESTTTFAQLERAEALADALSYLEIAWLAAGLLGAWTLKPERP